MRMDIYPCLTRQLITSYREQFDSPNMNFVAVQLPGTFPRHQNIGRTDLFLKHALPAAVTAANLRYETGVTLTYMCLCLPGYNPNLGAEGVDLCFYMRLAQAAGTRNVR